MPEPYVFISGRYGDYDGYLAIERRILRAREAAVRLAVADIPYFCPHLNSAHFEAVVPHVPRDFWLRNGRAFLDRAAALLVVWEEAGESEGVQQDLRRARELAIPIYWTPDGRGDESNTTPDVSELIRDWPKLGGYCGAPGPRMDTGCAQCDAKPRACVLVFRHVGEHRSSDGTRW